MKRFVLVAVALLIFIAAQGYAQDNQPPADQQNQAPVSTEAAAPAPVATPVQPQEVSIYGEVKSVNVVTSSMTIQYYDYDSDEEKSIEITTDGTTKMENAAAISDVKQGNWADVIYSVANGKNIAKSIIVEKEEEAPAVEMPKAEDQPAQMPKQ
jgi:hypothetical protein